MVYGYVAGRLHYEVFINVALGKNGLVDVFIQAFLVLATDDEIQAKRVVLEGQITAKENGSDVVLRG